MGNIISGLDIIEATVFGEKAKYNFKFKQETHEIWIVVDDAPFTTVLWSQIEERPPSFDDGAEISSIQELHQSRADIVQMTEAKRMPRIVFDEEENMEIVFTIRLDRDLDAVPEILVCCETDNAECQELLFKRSPEMFQKAIQVVDLKKTPNGLYEWRWKYNSPSANSSDHESRRCLMFACIGATALPERLKEFYFLIKPKPHDQPRHSISLGSSAGNRTFYKLMPSKPILSSLGDIEDGPLFRATVSDLEKRTITLKAQMKKAVKAAQAFTEMTKQWTAAHKEFMQASALIPTLDSNMSDYLKSTSEMMSSLCTTYHHQVDMLLIQPLMKVYESDVKAAEHKKKDFDHESSEYNSIEQKYLSIKETQRQKKRDQTDAKYQNKRKAFELKRFDYYTSLVYLHGAQTESEVTFLFSNFAEKQMNFFTNISNKLQDRKGELEGISFAINETTKLMNLQRRDLLEKRRTLEIAGPAVAETLFQEPFFNSHDPSGSINDLQDVSKISETKKEGFLIVNSTGNLSTPKLGSNGSLNWKKTWCVVSNGRLQGIRETMTRPKKRDLQTDRASSLEHANWKKLNEVSSTLGLGTCTIREARNVDRRFCFEILSAQQGRRVYQATDAEDLKRWMKVIQNSIEAVLNGTVGLDEKSEKVPGDDTVSPARTLASMLRGSDDANRYCADCGAKNPEWVSINLGYLICIGKAAVSAFVKEKGLELSFLSHLVECSGIHRGLGTHVTKIRSLTLDTISFTPELVDLVKAIGNTMSNRIWEKGVNSADKIQPDASQETRQKYIIAKYVDRVFVQNHLPLQQKEELFMSAVRSLNIKIVLRLIAEGVMVSNYPDALYEALGYMSLPLDPHNDRFLIAELLIQNGSTLDALCEVTLPRYLGESQKSICSLLHCAAALQDLDAITYLLEKGADPNIKDTEGHTPLQYVPVFSWDALNLDNPSSNEKDELAAICAEKLKDVMSKRAPRDSISSPIRQS